MSKKKFDSNGFTLIELLVVIGIIGILASMLLPALAKGKERAWMTQSINNLRQMGMGVKFYVDDHQGTFPPSHVYDPEMQQLLPTGPALGGFDPDPLQLSCFPRAKLRPLYDYIKPSEVYHCPADKGQKYAGCCGVPYLKPTNWESLGCSYQYNDNLPLHLAGGGFKELPEGAPGIAGKSESWAPAPERYILLHEPPARIYGCPLLPPSWHQWHYARGKTDIEDPQTARQDFISPIAFVDGHVAQHNFSPSLAIDPYFPYEPTKDWMWYKPTTRVLAQR